MFELRDLFQWERFITPSIIKIFYWLVVILCLLVGVAGVLGGLAAMFVSPLGGLVSVVGSLIGMLIGIIFDRIMAEYVLIMFRINEHLGAIRNRGGM
jgi:predicted membrane metal-binding protein